MKLNVKIERAIWRSTSFCGLTYFLFGLLLAAAYPAVSSDNILQEMLASSDTPVFAQVAIFAFDLFTILPGEKQVVLFSPNVRHNVQGELRDPDAIRLSLLQWLQATFKDEARAREADPQLLHLLLQPSSAAANADQQSSSAHTAAEKKRMLTQQEAATTVIAAAALQLQEPGLSKTFSRLFGGSPSYHSETSLHTPEQQTLLSAELGAAHVTAAAAAAAASSDGGTSSLQQQLLRHDSLGPLRGSPAAAGDHSHSLPQGLLPRLKRSETLKNIGAGDSSESLFAYRDIDQRDAHPTEVLPTIQVTYAERTPAEEVWGYNGGINLPHLFVHRISFFHLEEAFIKCREGLQEGEKETKRDTKR
uniref:Uncharacterized protein n=1 Tax=Eimeria maxima TaxID=5804 RepID=U5U323_EIMMA|nr:TEs-related hypothetical protein [Eimeria maxima]